MVSAGLAKEFVLVTCAIAPWCLQAATDCSEEEEQEWLQEAEVDAAASLGPQPGTGSAPRARKKVTRGRFALSSALVARLLGAIPTKPRPVHLYVTVRGKPHLQDTQVGGDADAP